MKESIEEPSAKVGNKCDFIYLNMIAFFFFIEAVLVVIIVIIVA